MEQLRQNYEPYKAQEDIDLFFSVFPQLSEHLRTVQLCKGIGLTIETIKKLFNGEIIPFTGKLHSPDHDRNFNVQDAKLELLKEQGNQDKFRLSLNGKNILDWFKQKFEELQQKLGVKPRQPPTQSRGRGI